MSEAPPSSPGAARHRRLSVDLDRVLGEHPEGDVTIGELIERIGDRGFGLFLLVLSLPSALPVPAPGYSTPFGIAIVGLAAQMIAGRDAPWLPERVAARRLPGDLARKMLRGAISFLARAERLIRPRFRWLQGRFGLRFVGLLVTIMGGLMILPIPLTNTAPAMVIFLIGLGLIEEDGLAVGLAAALGVAATAFYAGVLWLIVAVGMEAQEIKDAIKAALKDPVGWFRGLTGP